MIRRLKELLPQDLTNQTVDYREDTFSTNIGLLDLKVEPFSVSS